jgi:hypothetical protein
LVLVMLLTAAEEAATAAAEAVLLARLMIAWSVYGWMDDQRKMDDSTVLCL